MNQQMAPAAQPVQETEADTRPLFNREVCDRCGARAVVEVTVLSGTLTFCGHHYNHHEDALAKVAVTVQDARAEAFPG